MNLTKGIKKWIDTYKGTFVLVEFARHIHFVTDKYPALYFCPMADLPKVVYGDINKIWYLNRNDPYFHIDDGYVYSCSDTEAARRIKEHSLELARIAARNIDMILIPSQLRQFLETAGVWKKNEIIIAKWLGTVLDVHDKFKLIENVQSASKQYEELIFRPMCKLFDTDVSEIKHFDRNDECFRVDELGYIETMKFQKAALEIRKYSKQLAKLAAGNIQNFNDYPGLVRYSRDYAKQES